MFNEIICWEDYLLSIMFLLKKSLKYFSSLRVLHNKGCFMWWRHQLLQNLFFQDMLRMISHIDFRFDSINFHKQRKQPTKHQHLGIAFSMISQVLRLIHKKVPRKNNSRNTSTQHKKNIYSKPKKVSNKWRPSSNSWNIYPILS